MALGFLTATILSGCGSSKSAPALTGILVSFNGGSSHTISQGQSILLTVSVTNDPSGKGVIWKLAGPGTFSKQTGTSVQYDAPASMASTVTATVTATSFADPSKSATATIAINRPPLAIATSSLPDGVTGTPYSQAIQATGGVAPFTWFVSVGTLPHNLKLDNSNTSKLTISGTPDMQQAAVRFTLEVTDSANQSATTSYTLNISGPPSLTIDTSSIPPATINVPYPSFSFSAPGGFPPVTWSENGTLPAGLTFARNGTLSGTPTVMGSFPIMVTVTDSQGQAVMKPFIIVVYPASAVLNGRYVFQFQGFNSGGAFAAVGSFKADGFGNITDAVLDTNGVGGPQAIDLALAGTYSFDTNNLGTMTLTGSQGNAIFRFALNPSASDGISTGGKITEFDNLKSGTGFIAAQDTTAFSKSAITGDYLFNFAGSTLSLERVSAVGRLSADGLGSFDSGVMDMNESGRVFADATFTGRYDVPAASTNGRGTATLNTTLGGTPLMRNFTFYIQKIDNIPNAAALIFLGNDPVSATLPLLSGSMEPHAAAFTDSSLAGSIIFSTTGVTNAGLPDVTLGVVTITSSGNYALTADENSGGTITINNVAGTYSVEPNGRVTLTGGNHPPVLYLSGPNSGYILGTDGNASAGTVFARTVPLSLEGSLSVSTGVPVAGNQENDFGTLTFGGGVVNGNLNIESPTGFQPNTAVVGTYSLGADGRGTLLITSGLHTGSSVFYLTGHSRLVLLNSNNPGDIVPVLFSGGCIHLVSSPRGGEVCQ
jgi:hypothetical protein